MKSKNTMLMISVIAAALLLAGCINDSKDPETGPEKDRNSITFSLPGVNRGGITYASTVGDEAKLENLDIFMFDSTAGTLESVYRHGENIELDTTPPTGPTAKIDVTEKSGAKKFFFVGNAKNISSELDRIRYGETTVAEFMEIMSDIERTLPVTPLLMTGKGEVADVTQPTADEKKIQLIRRVARFDVDNTTINATEPDKSTNFVLTEILISNVSKQAYLFGDALGTTPGKTIETENAEPIAFGTQTNANEGNTPAVFYVYPSTLKAGKMEISLEGTFQGKPRIMELKPGTDFPIEANKCYTIKPVKINQQQIIAEITVKDWEEGTGIETQPGKNLVSATDITKEVGNGVLTGTKLDRKTTYDLSKVAGVSKFTFTTTSYRATGTKAKVRYLKGEFNDLPITVNDPAPALTYGARYEQKYVVEIANKTLTRNINVEAEVEIVNVYDPIQILSFKIICNEPVYPVENGTIDAVVVDGIWWAPVNAGAKAVGQTWNNNDHAGKLYQWGRGHIGWFYSDTSTNYGSSVTLEQSLPPDGTYRNHFIYGTTTANDWCTTQYNDLWSGDNRQGPCPDGWRVPTKAELDKILIASNNSSRAAMTTHSIRINGDISGKYLYFPALGGYKEGTNNNLSHGGSYGYYWTCDPGTSNPRHSWSVRMNNVGGSIWQERYRSMAQSVRCILDE